MNKLFIYLFTHAAPVVEVGYWKISFILNNHAAAEWHVTNLIQTSKKYTHRFKFL